MRYVLRTLIVLHRWVGIALCLFFLLWFPSGIGMMYWGFPGVSASDRLDRSPRLDPAKIVISPSEAAERVGVQANSTQIRLNSFDGRPVYRFGSGGKGRAGGSGLIVYADTGDVQTEVSSEMLGRIASSWAGMPLAGATRESVQEPDQWTVAGQLRNLRPMYKYSWPDGQQVYLNGITGEVVQYTTLGKRLAAHISAIPHWLYYTPLRKYQSQWLSFMIWTSLIGTIGAIIGIVVALWMYSPRLKYRLGGTPTGIPYRGQKRWHWIFGMDSVFATVTWTFSGLMSLGPFPLVERLTQTGPRPGQPRSQEQQDSSSRRRGPRRRTTRHCRSSTRPRVALADFKSAHPQSTRKSSGPRCKGSRMDIFRWDAAVFRKPQRRKISALIHGRQAHRRIRAKRDHRHHQVRRS